MAPGSWAQRAQLGPEHTPQAKSAKSAESHFPALGRSTPTSTPTLATAPPPAPATTSWSDIAKLTSAIPPAAPASNTQTGNRSKASRASADNPIGRGRRPSWADTASITSAPVLRVSGRSGRSNTVSTNMSVSSAPTAGDRFSMSTGTAPLGRNRADSGARWASLAGLAAAPPESAPTGTHTASETPGDSGRARKTPQPRTTRQLWRKRKTSAADGKEGTAVGAVVDAAAAAAYAEADRDVPKPHDATDVPLRNVKGAVQGTVGSSTVEHGGPGRRDELWTRIAAIQPMPESDEEAESGMSVVVIDDRAVQGFNDSESSGIAPDTPNATPIGLRNLTKLRLPNRVDLPDGQIPIDTASTPVSSGHRDDSSESTVTLVDNLADEPHSPEEASSSELERAVPDPPCIVDGSRSRQWAKAPTFTPAKRASYTALAHWTDEYAIASKRVQRDAAQHSTGSNSMSDTSSVVDAMDDPGYTAEMRAGLRHLASIAPRHFAARADSHRLLCHSLDRMAKCLSGESTNYLAGRYRLLSEQVKDALATYTAARDRRAGRISTRNPKNARNEQVDAVFSAIDTRKIHHFLCDMSRRGLLTLDDDRRERCLAKDAVSATLRDAVLGMYDTDTAHTALYGLTALMSIKRDHYKRSSCNAWCTDFLDDAGTCNADSATPMTREAREQALGRALKATWMMLETATSAIPSSTRAAFMRNTRRNIHEHGASSAPVEGSRGGKGKAKGPLEQASNEHWPRGLAVPLQNGEPVEIDLLHESVDTFLALARETGGAGYGDTTSTKGSEKGLQSSSEPVGTAAAWALSELDDVLQVDRHPKYLSNKAFLDDGILDTDLLEAKEVNEGMVRRAVPTLERLSAALKGLSWGLAFEDEDGGLTER